MLNAVSIGRLISPEAQFDHCEVFGVSCPHENAILITDLFCTLYLPAGISATGSRFETD